MVRTWQILLGFQSPLGSSTLLIHQSNFRLDTVISSDFTHPQGTEETFSQAENNSEIILWITTQDGNAEFCTYITVLRLQLAVITLLQFFIYKCNVHFYRVTFCVFCENYLENVGELQENFLWLKHLKVFIRNTIF